MGRGRHPRGLRRAALILVNVAGVLGVLAIVALMLSQGAIDRAPTGADAAPEATPSIFPTLTAQELAPVVRIAIPAIHVDAPIVELGVDSANQMEVPNRPDVVAWYRFTAQPGNGGNAVFAAHVNWHTGEYAVFGDLARLVLGDEVQLTVASGDTFRYRVTSLTAVDAVTTDAATVTGPTTSEVITLITCHGAFDWNLAQYRERLVVRAVRVE